LLLLNGCCCWQVYFANHSTHTILLVLVLLLLVLLLLVLVLSQ
jgi:hypothetical protein